MKPSKFQTDCILFVLESSKSFVGLLGQLSLLELVSIEHTGVGCIYNYQINDASNIQRLGDIFIINDGFHLETDSLPYGASIDLSVRNGMIDAFKILAHGSAFPKEEPKVYNFKIFPVNIIQDNNTA